jgi:tetratricopeptide (TPR) repeat protein
MASMATQQVLIRVAIVAFTSASLVRPSIAATDGPCEFSPLYYEKQLDRLAACSRLIASGKITGEALAKAYANRGSRYHENGQRDRAINDYTAAIAIMPDQATYYFQRAFLYHGKSDYRRALADYTAVIRLNPNDYVAFLNRGNVHKSINQYEEAISDYTEAIRLKPSYSSSWSNRAELYLNQKKDYDRAIADLGEVIRLHPESTFNLLKRAAVYEVKGDFARALDDYRAALWLYRTDARRARREAIQETIRRIEQKVQETNSIAPIPQ